MPTYRAELPDFIGDGELVEALRGLGAVHLEFRAEFPNRASAVRELGDEYGWRGFDDAWWDRNLTTVRTRKS